MSVVRPKDTQPPRAEPPDEREALRSELERCNDEIEALRRELEETNRGVVALYAELDDKAAALREVSDLKSRFLSYMSHEFRTPLGSIRSMTRLLLDRMDGPLTSEQ
jgi:signal transduction histidine kinase